MCVLVRELPARFAQIALKLPLVTDVSSVLYYSLIAFKHIDKVTLQHIRHIVHWPEIYKCKHKALSFLKPQVH
jgi:hypothetical protein